MAEIEESRVETAIETIAKQFEGYHETQIEIFNRLDANRAVQDEVIKRLDKQTTQNEKRIRQNEIAIGNLDKRLVRLETRVDRIDNTVTEIRQEQKEFRIYVDDRFDGVYEKFDKIDEKFDRLDQRIFWRMTGGVAFLTLVISIMTVILKFL